MIHPAGINLGLFTFEMLKLEWTGTLFCAREVAPHLNISKEQYDGEQIHANDHRRRAGFPIGHSRIFKTVIGGKSHLGDRRYFEVGRNPI